MQSNTLPEAHEAQSLSPDRQSLLVLLNGGEVVDLVVVPVTEERDEDGAVHVSPARSTSLQATGEAKEVRWETPIGCYTTSVNVWAGDTVTLAPGAATYWWRCG